MMQDKTSLKIAAVCSSVWEADDQKRHQLESTTNWNSRKKTDARTKKSAFSGFHRPLRTHEYKATRVIDFCTSVSLRPTSYKSGNDYTPATPTISHPKPWDSGFTQRKSLMPRKQVEERRPDPYQDPTSYQYGTLPHILGLKGRLFMSKRAKTAWLSKKNKKGGLNNRRDSRHLVSPIRNMHRSRHAYEAI